MRRVAIAVAACCALSAMPAPAEAVVGGKAAPQGSFRYVANISVGGSFGCSGTLIAPQWVMTAGHCGSITGSATLGLVPAPAAWPAAFYGVVLGSVYANGRGGEEHSVTKVIVESDYIVTNGTGNDVTLLKIDRRTRIAPMHIAAVGERSLWRPGVLATIAGFGTTSESSTTPPPRMRYARGPIPTDAYRAKADPGGLSPVADGGSLAPQAIPGGG